MNLARLVFIALVSLGSAGPLSAQQAAQGSLIVANPSMPDTSFSRSVVLLLRHDDNGSLGILINRPTVLEPAAVFAELATLVDYDGTLFYGGPVLPTRLLLLLRNPPGALVDGAPLFGNVFVSSDPTVLTRASDWPTESLNLRIYAGHTAWEPGQLDAEIADGYWRVVEARTDLVFSEEPLELWQRALGAEGEVVVSAE